MTAQVRRIALGIGASLLALGVSAGVYASAQNTSQDPRPFRSGGPDGPGRRGGPGRGGPGGPMGMLPMFGRQIGLTDAQRDQIKTIADAIDDATIRQKSAEVAAIDADLAVARAHAHAEVFQILTSDQKAQVKKMQADMKNRMKNRPQARLGRVLDRLGL